MVNSLGNCVICYGEAACLLPDQNPYCHKHAMLVNVVPHPLPKAQRKQPRPKIKPPIAWIKQFKACEVCGFAEVPEIFQKHHIYGKWTAEDKRKFSNEEKRLLCVCPNCHVRIHKGLNPEYSGKLPESRINVRKRKTKNVGTE